jgi:hypothetical protein
MCGLCRFRNLLGAPFLKPDVHIKAIADSFFGAKRDPVVALSAACGHPGGACAEIAACDPFTWVRWTISCGTIEDARDVLSLSNRAATVDGGYDWS